MDKLKEIFRFTIWLKQLHKWHFRIVNVEFIPYGNWLVAITNLIQRLSGTLFFNDILQWHLKDKSIRREKVIFVLMQVSMPRINLFWREKIEQIYNISRKNVLTCNKKCKKTYRLIILHAKNTRQELNAFKWLIEFLSVFILSAGRKDQRWGTKIDIH